MTGPDFSSQQAVESGLSASKADGCIVIAEDITDANLRWASNTLTTNGVSRSRQVTVIAVIDGAAGVVTRQGVTPEAVAEVVAAAEHAARRSSRAEDEAPLVDPGASSGQWDTPPAETSISVFAEFAPALGEAFKRAESAGELLFGFATHEMRTTYLGSSTGLRCRYDQPTGHAELNAKSPDYVRSTWAGVPTTDFLDVDLEALTSDLSRRLGWASRAIELPPGRYRTILPPSAVADMMIPLYWAASARNAYDGRTVFSRPGNQTRVGEQLTEAGVSLRSDPTAPGISCAPFVTTARSSADSSIFDNGSPLEPTAWISDGVLTSLVQTRYSARLTGLPFTSYIDNLIMDPGPAAGSGLDQVMGELDRGLLLTCLWYIREVDPQTLLLTGLTRDGVYLVEGGEVVGAVNNFRFNESPVDLLARIEAAGRSERTLPREWSDYFGRTSMPPLVVADFNMSSVSQAA
jgi:predicted Zn-dependent protease